LGRTASGVVRRTHWVIKRLARESPVGKNDALVSFRS
jgi:hypothetical protein